MSTAANNDWSTVEVGYVFLEDCIVSLTSSTSDLPSHEWFDLDLTKNIGSNNNSDSTSDCCFRCEILVHHAPSEDDARDNDDDEQEEVNEEISKKGSKLYLVNNSIRFCGFTSDVKPDPVCCSPDCCSKRRKRNDVALLLGLVLTCQDHQHVVVQKASILFKTGATDISSSNEVTSRRRAAIYVTISVPHLRAGTAYAGQQSMVLKGQRGTTSSAKTMPASTQLLLSLIRSDWQRLDELVSAAKITVSPQVLTTELPDLFPTKLTLDELYVRIRGLSTEPDEDAPRPNCFNGSTSFLTNLPKEVVISYICPYLRARSLDSLRSTCWHFHEALSFVVPGLKLKLYNHQIKSLKWMRMRECQHVSERDILSNPKLLHLQRTGGDLHRAVTGGATVALVPRPLYDSGNTDTVRISQEYGNELSGTDAFTVSRDVARGGLLCDDPGLGKTITVLSLILQTIGLTTNAAHKTSTLDKQRSNEDKIFDAYWRESMTPEFQRPALCKLFLKLERTDDGIRLNRAITTLDADANSLSFFLITKKIQKDDYKESFSLFQDDLKRCIENIRDSYSPDDEMYAVAARQSLLLDELVKEFKTKQLSSARKSFSNAMAKPNSSVAALLDEHSRSQYVDALIPSKTTLLVLPSTLMDHWENQIRLHVDFSYCTEKEPVVFCFGKERDCDLRLQQLEQVVVDCTVRKRKSAFVFLDKSTVKPLPQPEFLAMFDIVITTTQRFTNEWKKGSFQDELRREKKESESNNFEYEMHDPFQDAEQACPLLKIRWLRMIVDEGHSMGRAKTNSAIQFASWISAERRWAMTGTPTRQTAADCGIVNASFLMKYLQHDFFSSRMEGEKVWKNLIAKDWKDGFLASFFRLRALLGFLMVRHTKMDIKELPQPLFRETVLSMSNEEIRAYNSIVWGVQSNLVLTTIKGDTSAMQDSLLDPTQFKYAFEAMSNIRLACGCGGTHIITRLSERFHKETISMLNACHLPDFKIKVVNDHIIRSTHEEYSSCMPGFYVEWKPEDNSSQPGSPNQQYVGEENHVIVGDPGSPVGGNVALHSGATRTRTRRPHDGHICKYLPNYFDGKCILCLEEHDSCVLVDRSRCSVCFRRAELCPKEESKSTYIINKLLALRHSFEVHSSAVAYTDFRGAVEDIGVANKRPLKAIVFSQFRKALDYVGNRLLRRFGAGCVAEYWGRFRQQELRKFSKDPNCFCMLLGKDGSEGLDLSFVTHIFFLEQVWDKSLQKQTVARAWRMGAQGRVEVETLIAEKTVEELMSKLELECEDQHHPTEAFETDAQSVWNASETGSIDKYRRAKLQFLLKNLRLIRSDDADGLPKKSKPKRKRAVIWDEPDELPQKHCLTNEAFENTFCPPETTAVGLL